MKPSQPVDFPKRGSSRRKTTVLLVLAVVILIPASVGFIDKFVEFIKTLRQDPDGQFTIIPILNYSLVTAGFLCMMVWATLSGMFRDIEGPKYTMLEQENQIERADIEAGRL